MDITTKAAQSFLSGQVTADSPGTWRLGDIKMELVVDLKDIKKDCAKSLQDQLE